MYMRGGRPQQMDQQVPQQALASYGRAAPQQGNAGGGAGVYSQSSGAASQRPVQGLATALSGQRPQTPAQQPQQPQQQANHAFANWNEPGAPGAPPPGVSVMAGMNRPVAGQMQSPPVSGYVHGLGPNRGQVQGAGQNTGHGPSYVGGDSMQADTGNGLGVQSTGATRDPTSRMAQRGPMPLGQFSGGGQQSGPPMMGPATGSMSLSGALGGGQQSGTNRMSSGNPFIDRLAQASLPIWFQQSPDGSGKTIGQSIADKGMDEVRQGTTGGGDNRGPLGALGYDAGKAASAFPSGFASGLNDNELINLNNYYNNFSDIQGLHDQGQNLMDPAQQAAADAAERQAMQTGINSQRDDALRMLMGQRGRGGMVGSGATTGILNGALRAQALGEQNLAQDQYQRMLGRDQLGGQLISDYGRQKYGLMNDQYTSGGDVAALLLGGGKSAAGAAGSGAQGLGSILAALAPLIAGGAAAI